MMPDFEWSEEEQVEIQETLESTKAWQRYLDEAPEAQFETKTFFGRFFGGGWRGLPGRREHHKDN